jgi:predicted ATPase
MRATLDWSYRLLDAAEARTLAQLSVFVDGWTLEAAEAVCDETDLLDVMARLLDHSMIAAGPVPGRLRMLRTVREYAHELLGVGSEREAVCARFVRWCVEYAEELAEQARDGLIGTATSSSRAALSISRSGISRLPSMQHSTPGMGRVWLL